MSPETARCFALMLAEQARIEGMKAANAERLLNGYDPTYEEAAFQASAFVLEQLSIQVINQ